MKIFDLFAFSEPYELELLLLKLTLEDKGVAGWIIAENDYSLRGEYKGLHRLRHCINTDERFAMFLDKIHIVEMSFSHPCQPGIDDFTVLYKQRDAELAYAQQFMSDDDILMVSDLDESVDYFSPGKIELLNYFLDLKQYDVVAPMAHCYSFDFDNYVSHDWDMIRLLSLRNAKKIGINLQNLKVYPHVNRIIDNAGKIPFAFHYWNCVPKADIMRKFKTYGHTGIPEEYLESMLKYNHGWGAEFLSPFNLNKNAFIGKVELTECNSPAYVRENIDKLRTNNVNPDYESARRKDFPQFYEDVK